MRLNGHTLDWLSAVLIIVGAVNWGLVGLFKLEMVSILCGVPLARVVFMLIGAAGLHAIYDLAALYGGGEEEPLAEHPAK